ncbi:MAG: Transposase [Chloroflexi bacterium]|nr:Transposase [Chloroflexota bacterium]
MLGPAKDRDLDRPVLVSLEALVPADHFYRHLQAALDLSFVREWVTANYAPSGRPSIDPVVFFKLQLLLFFENMRSERQLIETASLHLAHRWYLGYALDEPLPDHSSLTRIRGRLGLPLFRRFFEHIVELCQDAGLVWGKEILADATKVPGNAAKESLVPRLKEVIDGHLVALFGEQEARVEGESWDVLEHCTLAPDRPLSPNRERRSHRKVSRTDADASPMVMRDGRTVLGYHTHYLVDGGRARIILHCLVTPSDIMENQPFVDQFRRTLFRYQLRPRRVIADTTYGTAANIRAIEAQDIRMYTPLPDREKSSPYFPPSAFAYDADRDVNVCPQGATLTPGWVDQRAERVQYHAPTPVCRVCALRARCVPGWRGRLLYRSFAADYLDRVRSYHTTPAFEQAMRKRSVWVEPLFGEAKQWHGLHKLRFRGLRKLNIQGVLIVAG